MDRRTFLRMSGAAAGAVVVSSTSPALAQPPHAHGEHAPAQPPARDTPAPTPARDTPARRTVRTRSDTPGSVITPNGRSLPLRDVGGVKVGHLVAEVIQHEFAPGLVAECWGYNGGTPGPTIEVTEGDRLRMYVTNRLPAPTTVHWHGVILPNGMDGVSGLNQPAILPGQTYVYEFTVAYPATHMYHAHFDEMTQIGIGLTGMFIVHPRRAPGPRVDRDFALLTHEWRIDVGTRRPNPIEMIEFNVLTFNNKVFPATEPLMVGLGERVRIRLGNLSPMDHHPIHVHGVSFRITQTDGGYVPTSAQWPETTVIVPVGSARVIELVPTFAGDWAVHCHMTHHLMTQMGHDIPNMLSTDPRRLDRRMQRIVPGFMSMGTTGFEHMDPDHEMPIPENSIPMRGGPGPFGHVEMGGMFTVMKVREDPDGADPSGWYTHPPGTVAWLAGPAAMRADGIDVE
jgi:FtsP/CotA-like multicopper oxidase with cupredoxin domain